MIGEPSVEIRDLERGEVALAARVLAEAFADNPGMLAIFDDASREQRVQKLERLYLSIVEASRLRTVARVLTRNQQLLGVQLAYEPAQYPPAGKPARILMGGLLRAELRYLHRLVIGDFFLRSRHITRPHCYLFMLGVKPEAQGQGLGGALLRDFNRRARELGVPAYLETDREAARNIYLKDGYRTLREEVYNLQGNIRVWFMLKSAEALGAAR